MNEAVNGLLIYLIIINTAAFFAYLSDKRRAVRRAWRIPETVLLLLAFFGGAAGALLSMLLFRHKTKHAKFYILVPLMLLLHLFLACTMLHNAGIIRGINILCIRP